MIAHIYPSHANIPAPAKLKGRDKAKWNRLMRALDQRQGEHGHAFVTAAEARWLKGWRLNQPGHTRYPYSVPGEDLSDAAQEV